MCQRVIHAFKCGHTEKIDIPCARVKTASCGEVRERTLQHDEKCYPCGGGKR